MSPIPKRVLFVGPQTYPTGKVDTTNFGLNDSALPYPWASAPMLTELTGTPFTSATFQEGLDAPKYCNGSVRWPEKNAVIILGELAIVCL